jgi:ferric enterobactin receptor
MMLRVVLVCFLLLGLSGRMAADSGDGFLRGTVRDVTNGETLPYASVCSDSLNQGTIADRTGYYLLQLPPGRHKVTFSYVGYDDLTEVVRITLDQTAELLAELPPVMISGDEIEVIGKRVSPTEMTPVGSFGTRVTELARIPSVGQPDLLRSLQLLPGVQSSSENSAGLYVRGGTPGQNLILLDDVVVYNPNHLFGFFSTFNPDALKEVLLLKGTFPARYGDRLSSVLDITNLDGNQKTVTAKASLDMISAGLTLEGPVGNTGSWMLSGRRTYQELLNLPLFDHIVDDLFSTRTGTITTTNAGPPGNGGRGGGFGPGGGGFGGQRISFAPETSSFNQDYGFYDANFKMTLEPSTSDRLSLSGYVGNDVLDLALPSFRGQDRNQAMDWGNRVGQLSWTHLYTDQLLGTVRLSASHYGSDFGVAEIEQQVGADTQAPGGGGLRGGFSLDRNNELTDLTGKADFSFFMTQNHTLRFGAQVTDYNGSFSQGEVDSLRGTEINSQSGYQTGYGELNLEWDRLQLTPGIRFSHFNRGSYSNVSPRVSGRFALSENLSLKGGWGIYHQYINLITVESFSYSTDMWLPVDETVSPGKAVHTSGGLAYTSDSGWELDSEVYYKDLDNLVEFQSQVRLDDSTPLADLFLQGAGTSYGVELLLRKTEGRTKGWIAYTLGKTEHTFDGLNNGSSFSPTYDRRHDLSLVANHHLGSGWNLNSNWVFGSGQAYTIPESQYTVVQPSGEEISYVHVSGKNAYRLPAYHRLDASISRDFKFGSLGGQVLLSVFNVYNRRNIWYRTFDVSEEEIQVQDVLLQPMLPSLGFKFNF